MNIKGVSRLQAERKSRVLIIGGYGNFGQFIAGRLADDPNIDLIIAGRSLAKAQELANRLAAKAVYLDIYKNLDDVLLAEKPDIVIHTSGPFQGQDYNVAKACIRHKSHYIDLADGRDFVRNITQLAKDAREAGVLIISGASSVPCLTSAILDEFLPQFRALESVDYGIATAQRTNPGMATTSAILEYTGKGFKTLCAGKMKRIFGWQDLTVRKYPQLGYRFLSNCDVPDLSLFPERYKDLRNLRFRAGLEIPLLHLGLWSLSFLVRANIIKSLKPFAGLFFKAGRLFNAFGSDRSGFHMEMKGTGLDGQALTKTTYLITASGHGPYIPCIPAIHLASEIAKGDISETGAKPCVGIITLDQYLKALSGLDIEYITG